MKRWIHASNIVDLYNVKQYLPKKYLKDIIEIEVNADFDNSRNRTVNYYTAWFSDKDSVSGTGLTQFVKNVKEYVDKMPDEQVKASQQAEAFNYSGYLIEYHEDGWYVFENYSYKELAGPFRTWVDAEEYVDQNLD